MQNIPLPYNETERLEALYVTGLLDSTPDPVFDAITLKVSQLTDCPSAIIGLIDKDELWLKSKIGLTVQNVPRRWSFCAYTILSSTDDILVIPDAHLDHRFASSPIVTGAPFFRFYAGAPIKSPDGYNIGAVGAMDTKPRADLSEHQGNQLKALAQEVSNAISDIGQEKAFQQSNPVDQKLGERLRQARVNAQLSQEDVASRLDISTEEMQRMESGVLRTEATLLLELSRILGVSMRSFFHDL
ncbi:MAG: GAF domain-containing protein [Hyphomicrobiaceae bacterium]|jgi:GAF domain-containing protein